MKIVAVDGDRTALEGIAGSIERAIPYCGVAAFTDALSAYKYCVNNADEISAVFVPVVLKPFDGLKLRELIAALPIPVNVVLTLREESDELMELVRGNGGGWHILKPVTADKVAAVAREMVCGARMVAEDCDRCPLCWCERWRPRRPRRADDARASTGSEEREG